MRSHHKLALACMLLFVGVPCSWAASKWYVRGKTGSDINDCKTARSACKTIGRAISLAFPGDSILVGAATYNETLSIALNLVIKGAGAKKTVVDAGHASSVLTVASGAVVAFSKITLQNGNSVSGAGVNNSGTLTLTACTIAENSVVTGRGPAEGGGIRNDGSLTIEDSTITGNITHGQNGGSLGAGIYNTSSLVIRNSTISGNRGNGQVAVGGGIYSSGSMLASSTTIAANMGAPAGVSNSSGVAVIQNTILDNSGANCDRSVTSNGYNLSSDNTCALEAAGDINSTKAQLGSLQDNGGQTETMALSSGSPAIDAGNPSGCADEHGHLLKKDQRGQPRPEKKGARCDMGAYELQSE